MNWIDVSKEEKRAIREWAMCQTGVLRAYKKGELNGMQYRWYKHRLADLLNNIKEHYDTE